MLVGAEGQFQEGKFHIVLRDSFTIVNERPIYLGGGRCWAEQSESMLRGSVEPQQPLSPSPSSRGLTVSAGWEPPLLRALQIAVLYLKAKEENKPQPKEEAILALNKRNVFILQ